MIEFKTIRYKNFLSSGNQYTEIELNQHKDTLIVGSNGSGKSTVLDALTFSLFNKPFRKISKSQLVNSTNEREAVVEIEFIINTSTYKVTRGIKPNIFIIEKDGKKFNEESSAIDQQKYLEGQILKLNYKSFTQIVILGSASFVPFMQLSAPHRREVIEDLLDIKILSTMADLLKEGIKKTKDTINVLDLKKESFADKIVMQQQFIRKIEEQGESDIIKKQEKIELCHTDIAEGEREIRRLISQQKKAEHHIEEHSNAPSIIRELDDIRSKFKFKKENAEYSLEYFQNNNKCTTCTQPITEEFRLDKVQHFEETIKDLVNNLDELQEEYVYQTERYEKLNGLQKRITAMNQEISNYNMTISNTLKLIKELTNEIKFIEDNIDNPTAEMRVKLTEYKDKLKSILKDLEETKEHADYLAQSKQMLTDDGVRRSIILKYLPLINKQVNDYLQRMDFFINFTLDEDFNEKIQTPIHEKFTYSSFSEGEKMRIDLALLFTWRDIARMKNSVVTNLLIMDEVFDSSLDGFGTDEFLKIVRFVIEGANVFIISHKNELYDKFHNTIEFAKEKGFSKIKDLT